MTVMLVILWGCLHCYDVHQDDDDDDMMCISLFSYGRPVVVRCMGVRLGMGWVSYLVSWVGLGR